MNTVKEAVPYTFLIFTAKTSEENLFINFIAGGLFFGLTLILTPLSCALANWYSFRVLNIVGPFLLLISMTMSHFLLDGNLNSCLILSFGILGGFGNSMLHVTSTLMPSYWFCNRRGLAHSLANFGHAVGFLIMTNTTGYLFPEGFKKKIWIFLFFSGFYGLVFFLGFLSPRECGVPVRFDRLLGAKSGTNMDNPRAGSRVHFKDEDEASILAQDSENYINQRLSYYIFKSHHNLIFPRVKDVIGPRNMTVFIPKASMKRVMDKPWKDGLRKWDLRFLENLGSSTYVSEVQLVNMVITGEPKTHLGSRPMYRTDIFYPWNVFQLPIYYRQDNQLDYHLGVSRAISTRDLMQEKNNEKCIIPEAMIRTLLTMLDYHIYYDFYMILLQFCAFLIATGQFIPLIFISNRANEVDYHDKETSLLVYAGIGLLLGHILIILYGAISTTDSYYSQTVVIFILTGLMTVAAGLVKEDILLIIYSLWYGFIHAVTKCFHFSIMYGITKLSDLTNATGNSFLWEGVGYIFSATISGCLYVKYSEVPSVFFLSGCAMFTSGVLLVVVRGIQACSLKSVVINL